MSASKKARKETGSTSTAKPTPKNLDAVTGNDKQKSKSKKKEKKKKAAGPAEADSLTLVIRNIPFDCDDAALKKIFVRHGTVTRMWLPEQDAPANSSSPADAALVSETEKSPATTMQEQQKRTRNRGFAFVRMSTLAEADTALERVNATKIRGRVVAVDRVVPREELMAAKESAADEDNDSAAGVEAAFDNEQSEVDDPRDSDTLGDVDGIDDDSEEGSGEDHQHGDDESVDIQFEPEDDGEFGSASTQTGRKNNAAKDDATVFIRNLSFDSTEEGLRERFSSFGRVRYAVVTVDPNSGRPRGTGFVSFVAAADAEKCLEAYAEAERAANLAEGLEKIESSAGAAAKTVSARAKKAGVAGASSSILVPEPSSTAPGAAPFVLDGRQLLVTRAVSRNEAARLAAAGAGDPSSRDRRNTYLLREGLVEPGTEAARGMPAEDLEKRQRSYTERRRLLQSNPNLYVSRTRLSVRNLPVRVDAPLLRRAAILAICRFWEEVYDRQRSGLEKAVIDQELNEGKQTPGASRRVVIKKCQIQHDESRIDSESGKPRSKGYGFIDFESHADALACLRWLNNNPLAFNAQGLPTSREELAALRAAGGHEVSSAGASSAPGKRTQQRRPVVEFAIENIIIVRRKQALAEGFRLKAAARAEADAAATKGAGAGGSERQQRREKRRRQAPSDAPDAGDAASPAKRRKHNPAAPTGAAASAVPAAGAKGSSKASPGSNAKVAGAAADDGRRGKADKHGGKKQAVVSRAERRDQAEEDRFNALLERYGKGLFGDRAASASTAAARSEAGASVPVGGSGISKWYS
ncbi:RNA recognition motif-containing protein [Cladochytrium tenue]|nr:RNA recognition motif-containing protein [Cladochytrium tenue]